jgi:NADPH:quinone reductase-like Zn-dependent oxidoreductase
MLASAPDGLRPGWDFAGILRTDVDGGPNAGERVVGIRRGQAWAERVSAPRNWVAALPDGITFTQAAALPTAGLTALRTLRFGPAILGRRVLVTGASGGVGRFAVQLAHLGGADVTVLVSVSGRFDLILESVGGSTLARLLTRLDPEGTLITFGNSSDETTTFNVSDVYPDALVRIRGFEVFYAPDPFARDLRFLADLVADGKLDPQLADEMPWEAMPKALQRLENRDVAGKVALTINV